MERRTLVTFALVEQKAVAVLGPDGTMGTSGAILGSDGRPLLTERNVRDAIARVARDLEDLRQARGYSEGSGWVKETPPAGRGEDGIVFTLVDAVGNDGEVSGEYAVAGQMILRRD